MNLVSERLDNNPADIHMNARAVTDPLDTSGDARRPSLGLGQRKIDGQPHRTSVIGGIFSDKSYIGIRNQAQEQRKQTFHHLIHLVIAQCVFEFKSNKP